jgi:hypothetical protein
MPIELLTVKDLEKFKDELLHEIKNLIHAKNAVEKKLLKTKEVCQILGKTPGSLQNLRKNKTLTFRKIGGTVYYKHEEITRMLK